MQNLGIQYLKEGSKFRFQILHGLKMPAIKGLNDEKHAASRRCDRRGNQMQVPRQKDKNRSQVWLSKLAPAG